MTAFIGDIRFNRPIAAGEIVEITARVAHTGRSSRSIRANGDVHVAIGRPADWRDSGTLGDLEFAPDELREAARVFVAEQCNATRAAVRLYTHRNTFLRRLARAEALLPRPLAESSIDVGVALNVLHWRGLARVS